MSRPPVLPGIRPSFLPFSRPGISEDEIAAVSEVLRSGWLTTGPATARFERLFAASTGSPGAVALASGTAAMHLLLKALEIGPGDEVITPSMTWVSTVNLIVLAGARPVFVDVDPDTLLASPAAIAAAMTPRTRLIVPVHYAGAPVDLDPIRSMASRHGIPVVEDAAHAAGTEYRGLRIGSAGTSVFSFHPIKNMTTGEGGMVCSDDPALLDRLRRLRFHGLGADAHDRETQGRAAQAEVLEPGFKYNLTDIASAIGIGQLERLDAFNRRRAELASVYRRSLAAIDEILPLADPPWPHKHAWHLFVIRLDTAKAGMDRDRFMSELKARNIGTGLHFKAVHLHRYYAGLDGFGRGTLPDTEWNSDRICSLPLFPDMTDDDAESVVEAIKDLLSS